MNRRIALSPICAVLGVLTSASLPLAHAAPQPDPVPTRWEFDFEPGELRVLIVAVDGVPRPFFYFTYKIVNHWDSDLLFAPDVSLVTDDGVILPAGQDASGQPVPVAATNAVDELLDNPLMRGQIEAVGQVLQGQENAQQGFLVWPVPDHDVDQIKIYFAGLSGENDAVVVGRGTDNPRRFVVRKTRELVYATPGEFRGRRVDPFELVEQNWVMR